MSQILLNLVILTYCLRQQNHGFIEFSKRRTIEAFNSISTLFFFLCKNKEAWRGGATHSSKQQWNQT